MDFIVELFRFVLHVDVYLADIIIRFGVASYAIIFLIVFAETGLVFTPFLPGDSLLFVSGAFAAIGSFHIVVLLALLWGAAFLGDTVNYWIGYYFGQKLIQNPKIPINQQHIEKTRKFYDAYGGKTIFIARFMPIIRTFAPFVAGIGKMNYKKFVYYNAAGGFVWVFGFTLAGYFFGNIPTVKENLSLVIIAIIVISVLPIVIEYVKARVRRGKQ